MEIETQNCPPSPGLNIKKVNSSSMVYYDEQGNEVDKEKGTKVRITEFDKNGDVINVIWGSYTPETSTKTK